MSNFDITELLTDRQTDGLTNGQTNGKAGTYVAISGGQGDFHARFDGCLDL